MRERESVVFWRRCTCTNACLRRWAIRHGPSLKRRGGESKRRGEEKLEKGRSRNRRRQNPPRTREGKAAPPEGMPPCPSRARGKGYQLSETVCAPSQWGPL